MDEQAGLRRSLVHDKIGDAAGTITKHVGHVIDGGYFDNNGTVSSQEVAAATMNPLGIAKFENACAPGFRKSIFLEILNDTSMTDLDSDRDNLDNDSSLASRVRELSILAPEVPFHPLIVAVNGLESSRAARAVHSSKTLARYSRSLCGSHYFMIPLCRGIVPSPALGWMLSEDSRAAMDRMLVGGIETSLYEKRADRLNFYDCYNLVQSNLVEIFGLLR
ncbi:hypothetical protein SAMN05216330_104532 [Bradyrhizobium sp. Ghvi]|uniref:hypothetical protein n=1 Tax=Bradyrhizobium sp. Ghvi TaxID=1855319 RepID=UPI0008E95F21|nr:hypothetical protein [Bradyrhizobium sp. Ghvi]SFO75796.1 hypothetical protein SAMN05216330_104532 [Bradyrhizobium sp. Ghvi]